MNSIVKFCGMFGFWQTLAWNLFTAIDAMVWKMSCVRIHILDTFDTPTLSTIEYYSLLTSVLSHILHQLPEHLFCLARE